MREYTATVQIISDIFCPHHPSLSRPSLLLFSLNHKHVGWDKLEWTILECFQFLATFFSIASFLVHTLTFSLLYPWSLEKAQSLGAPGLVKHLTLSQLRPWPQGCEFEPHVRLCAQHGAYLRIKKKKSKVWNSTLLPSLMLSSLFLFFFPPHS